MLDLFRKSGRLPMTLCRNLLLAAALASSSLSGRADEKPAPQADAAQKDYGALLPRIRPKAPNESLKSFAVRPGFHVELAAAEPLLRSPVAIDFDEDGRLYVAEFPEYNQSTDPKPHGKGCVRLLEDTDGDGVFDKSSVFADDVPMATAVACWDGGVYVGAPPDLLYLKDLNGDGNPERRVVLTGFGRDPAGEGMLNSIRWGLDNRLHISTGTDGGEILPGGQTGAKAVSVRGQNLLLDPRGDRLELTSGGGQHGMSMDDWGRAYVCGNSDPFQLVMYDSRYLARNPHLQAPPAAVNVAPAGKYTKLYRLSPVEPWRVLRTRLRTEGVVKGSDEGGSPSGFFTGATGVTVYRGDAFPAEFRGNLFVGDVSNNVVHRALSQPRGLLVTAESTEKGRDFLASRDNGFRPVQMASGPDGCLWVVDMCRELIEAAFLPPQILKHMDVGNGDDRGRIWRVVPAGHKPRAPKLSKATTVELVALLEHPNGWHRDTASRLLYQRQDRSAVETLRQLAAVSRTPLGRTHALHALAGLGALRESDLSAALSDQEPRVREHALRLAEPLCKNETRIQKRMEEMIRDNDPLVRYQLAFSLGALPGTKPAGAIADLAVREGADRWMRMAIVSSVSACTGEVFHRLAEDAGFRSTEQGRALLTSLAAQTGAAERADDLAAILKELDGSLSGDKALSGDVVMALLSKASAASQAQLSAAGGGRLRAILAELLTGARATAVDLSRSAERRAAAAAVVEICDVRGSEGALGRAAWYAPAAGRTNGRRRDAGPVRRHTRRQDPARRMG